MSRHSIAGIARKARAADSKLRAKTGNKSFTTNDSFQSFAAGLGIGTDNLTSSGTYGFNPVTRNHILLEWMYRGSWLAGVAVNIVGDDMTRAGVDLRGDVEPEEIEHLERAAVTHNIWPQIADTVKWARLFGGAICVMLVDGQNPSMPLRLETIGKGQFKGLMVLDRWMCEPSLNDLVTDYGPDLGLPKFYNVTADAPAIPRQKIHHSRCLRLVGIKQPYYQAMMENLWGISILERSFDRMLAFDSATSGVANLIYKAYLRTYGLKGLREAIAAGGSAEANVVKMVELMRRFQTIEGITLLDADDIVGVMTAPSFAGLSDALQQIGQQLCGSWQIPQTRFFGVSPGGMNATGESDMRMYYDGIKQQQMATLAVPVTRIYRAMAQSEGIKLKEGFSVDFRSLWVLSDEQKAAIAAQDTATVMSVYNSGVYSDKTTLEELRQLSKTTGRNTNISDKMIKEANDVPASKLSAAMGEVELDNAANPPEEEAPKAKKKAKDEVLQ